MIGGPLPVRRAPNAIPLTAFRPSPPTLPTVPEPSTVIHAIDVHKSYRLGDRSIDALRGATLSIDEPGFYAIMGPSGSGKSTRLHLLAAVDTPDKGELHVAGRRIDTLSEKELTLFRRREIGVVFQQFNLIPTMTARQNVELPGLLARPASFLRRRENSWRPWRWKRATTAPTRRPGANSNASPSRGPAVLMKVLAGDPPAPRLEEPEILWRLADLARERQMTMCGHARAGGGGAAAKSILHDGRHRARRCPTRTSMPAYTRSTV